MSEERIAAISGLLLRSGHLPCAVYYRPAIWKGPWRLHAQVATLEDAHGRVEYVLTTIATHGEAAIFAASTEPPVPDSDPKWPDSFTDGSEPGRLVYQITAVYRRTIGG